MILYTTGQFLKDISEYRSTMMGLSILAIILFHQDFVNGFPLNFFHYYGYWGVDIFLLLSGMGLVNSLNKYPIHTFYQRRLLRLFPSCIFCGIFKCVVTLLLSSLILLPHGSSHINWLSPLSLDLWYIRAIIVYYLLSPWLFKYLQRMAGLTMAIVFLIFFVNELFFRVHDSNSLSWIPERLLVFTIGMLLMLKKDLLASKTILLSAVFLIVAVTIAATYKGDIHAVSLPWAIMIFCLAIGTITIIYLTVFLLKHIPQSFLEPFKWAGTISLELYLVHEFIFGIVNMTMSRWLGNVGLLTISVIFSLLLAYLCKWTIDKVTKKEK